MSQIGNIIKRELNVRLKSRAFYLIVLLSPTLFLLPVIITMFGGIATSEKDYVGISSDFEIVRDTMEYKGLKFYQLSKDSLLVGADRNLGVLTFDSDLFTNFNSRRRLKLHINEDDLLTSKEKIGYVQNFINKELLNSRLKGINLADSLSNGLSNLKIVYPIINRNKKENAKKTATTLAFVLTMLMYVSFILFNNSILRSVIEEKSNKLAEVLSIFVSPTNIMAGKILGQSAAFIVQLVLWLVVFIIYAKGLGWIESTFISDGGASASDSYLQTTLMNLKNLPLMEMFVYLPLFFIFGFLLNGTFNTILGVYSSKGNSNFLMFAGNILNLIAIYFGVFAAISPDSTITKISYYIPFLNYLTVPTTLPFDLPASTIWTSLIILVLSTGILFYWCTIVYSRSIRN